MNRGDLTLDDALKSFERGVALTRQCQGALKAAQQKVEILLSNSVECRALPPLMRASKPLWIQPNSPEATPFAGSSWVFLDSVLTLSLLLWVDLGPVPDVDAALLRSLKFSQCPRLKATIRY